MCVQAIFTGALRAAQIAMLNYPDVSPQGFPDICFSWSENYNAGYVERCGQMKGAAVVSDHDACLLQKGCQF